jgi:hypothetical protein
MPTKTRLALLACAFAATPAFAADEPAAKVEQAQCVNQEEMKGHDEKPSQLICTVKRLFQSRIRSKSNEEPVEMTAGSPPLQTDDSDTPGARNWEVNLVLDADVAPGQRTYDAPLIDVNYGVGDRLQLKYEVPYTLARTTGTDATGAEVTQHSHGLANSTVGAKYRFYDDDASGLSLAVYPQLVFRTPGAKLVQEGGEAETATIAVLPLILTREFERWSLSANAGIEQASEDPHTSLFASAGAGTRIGQRVALLGEVAGHDLNAAERRVRVDAGLRWKLSERHALTGAIGRDVYAGSGEDRHWFALAAWQWFIGTPEKSAQADSH